MKVNEIRDFTDVELESTLADLKKELFNLRFQNATNQLENPMRIAEVKKSIARIKTVMVERKLEKAANKVLKKCDNVRFVMAGNGDLMNRSIRRVAKLGIADKFHFTGFLRGDDVKKMFAYSDVYIMPSVSEPFGISPLEAMKSNVPSIISKQSGVAEVLSYAIKTDFWDIDAMADAIYGLLKYPALASMSAKCGVEEVNNLKWENAALKMIDVYQEAIDNLK